jgi:hypothetical protein
MAMQTLQKEAKMLKNSKYHKKENKGVMIGAKRF